MRVPGTRILSGAWSVNLAVLRALQQRGFRLVRHSHRMLIDLDQPTPEPSWPEGTKVRTFEAGDERLFYDVHQETFKDSWEPIDEPYDEWAHWLLSPPTFVPELWFVAEELGESAGIAICHTHATMLDHGWIRILGARRHLYEEVGMRVHARFDVYEKTVA